MKIKATIKAAKGEQTFKVSDSKTLDRVYTLAKTEIFRENMLSDIDLSDVKIKFTIDGDKVSASKLMKILAKWKDEDSDSSKKDKDKKSKKKKKDKSKKDKKKSKKKDRKNMIANAPLDIEDGMVIISKGEFNA